jgi:hypothetical protein
MPSNVKGRSGVHKPRHHHPHLYLSPHRPSTPHPSTTPHSTTPGEDLFPRPHPKAPHIQSHAPYVRRAVQDREPNQALVNLQAVQLPNVVVGAEGET